MQQMRPRCDAVAACHWVSGCAPLRPSLCLAASARLRVCVALRHHPGTTQRTSGRHRDEQRTGPAHERATTPQRTATQRPSQDTVSSRGGGASDATNGGQNASDERGGNGTETPGTHKCPGADAAVSIEISAQDNRDTTTTAIPNRWTHTTSTRGDTGTQLAMAEREAQPGQEPQRRRERSGQPNSSAWKRAGRALCRWRVDSLRLVRCPAACCLAMLTAIDRSLAGCCRLLTSARAPARGAMSASSVAANGDAAPAAAVAAATGVAVSPPWFHSSGAVLDAPALLALRGASDDHVSGALSAVFRARNEGISVARRDRFTQELGKSAAETDALLLALSHLVHSFLYLGCDSKEAVFALFPRDFDKELRRSLSEKMMQKQPEWRETLLQSAVGPPKLVEFGQTQNPHATSNGTTLPHLCSLAPSLSSHSCCPSPALVRYLSVCFSSVLCSDWRVDVKSASNHLSNMQVPTVLVDIKVKPDTHTESTQTG